MMWVYPPALMVSTRRGAKFSGRPCGGEWGRGGGERERTDLVIGGVGDVEHIGDASELCGFFGDLGGVGAGKESGYWAAELCGSGNSGERGGGDGAGAVLEDCEGAEKAGEAERAGNAAAEGAEGGRHCSGFWRGFWRVSGVVEFLEEHGWAVGVTMQLHALGCRRRQE